MDFNWQNAIQGGGLSGVLGGIFGNSGDPYKAAMQQYQDMMNRGQQAQQPYTDAGKQALPDYQNWLKGQQDPSGFINNLMGQYQQSPWAKFQTDQGTRAANNAASASGLIGSTPLGQANANYAENISSQDMQNWLSNVLGINTQYGQGEQNLVSGGQSAANALTNMYGQYGQSMGDAAYGQKAGQQNDWNQLIGGGLQIGASLFGL